jgi:hypothetical protein
MTFMESAISEYLDAVEKTAGKEVRAHTMVEPSGGSHVVLKRPEDDEPQLIHLGRLEDMTDVLRHKDETLH